MSTTFSILGTLVSTTLPPPHTPDPLPGELFVQVIAPVRQRAQVLAHARASVVGASHFPRVGVPFGPGVGDVDRVAGVVHGYHAEVGAGVAVVVGFAERGEGC